MADVALSLPRNLLNQLLQRLNPLPPQVIFDCHFWSRVRLCRCCVELHYGSVLETLQLCEAALETGSKFVAENSPI